MAQITKMVDLTKSYIPGDPNAFPNNLQFTAKEDDPVQSIPILAYEGYNFLPTSYGYRSYFGTDSSLTLEALPKPCDEIITFQSKQYENMLIAFCSDGIRTAKAGATVWTHSVPLPDDYTNLQVYRQYTWCVIENNLYIYRQGHSGVIKIDDAHVITQFTPSFLNMAGQIGMFRGNGRLCFWDSENSISWSSAFDLTDFTPSIENMVGNTIFLGVLGRIVNILPHGEGYVIYSTRSIVGVSYNTTGTVVWDAMTITSAGGIAHPKACCIGQNDKEHFAYTTIGILSIGHFNALSRQYAMEVILPELFDYLKESRDPVYMYCHAARFLYFSLIDDSYINGITSFTDVEIPSLQAPPIVIDTSLWDTYGAMPYITPNETFQFINSQLWDSKDVDIIDRTLSVYEAPFFSVSMTHPSIPSQAQDSGLLQAGGMFKIKTPVLENMTVNEIVDRSFTRYNAVNPLAGTFDIIRTLMSNMENTRAAHGVYPTNACFERSFYKDLYPSKIADEPNSVLDLLYSWVSTIMEYEQFCEDQYARLVDRILEIHNTEFFDRVVYSSNPLTIDSTQDTTILYFPKAKVSFKAGLADNKTTHISNLYVNATIQQYVQLTSAICNRSLISSSQVPRSTAAMTFAIGMQTYNGSSFIDPTAYAYFDHYPTKDEIVEAFNNPAMYQTETATGHKWKLYYDDTELLGTPPIVGSGYTTYSYCRAVNLTTNAKAWRYFKVRILLPFSNNPVNNHSADVSSIPEYTHFANIYDQYTDYVAAGYKYLAALNYLGFQTDYINNQIGQAAINLRYVVMRGGTNINYTPIGGGAMQTLNTSMPTSVDLLPNGDLAYYAFICPTGSTDSCTKQVVFIHRAQKVYEYHLKEELILAPIPVDRTGLPAEYSKGGADFIFNVSQQGVNTIRRNVLGGISATPKIVHFTPNVVDPGVDQALYSVPANESYFLTTPTSFMPIQACTPWELKNTKVGATQVVNGQHFMEHAAGTMLSIPQPLGPILTLSDASNSCFPDLAADGWITSKGNPFTYPGTTYTLQDGIPVPAYPILVGSLVFDTQLKKWGKQAGEFTALLQFSPINETNNEAIPYTNFGMDSGILDAFNKKIKLFSVKNSINYMRYGKIALYRLGFTELLEVNINFRTPFTGSITVDGSIDDRNIEPTIQHVENFVDVRNCNVKCHVNAMWHTLSISGNFDLQYMEFRGIMAARR